MDFLPASYSPDFGPHSKIIAAFQNSIILQLTREPQRTPPRVTVTVT